MNPRTSAPFASHPVRRLVAYRIAIDVTTQVAALSATWSGWAHLADQARRASSSIGLNLGEGTAYKPGSGNRRKHYEIALGSAVEVAVALDTAAALALSPAEAIRPVQDELNRLIAMLNGLVRKQPR
jgi:four helix bundle protein